MYWAHYGNVNQLAPSAEGRFVVSYGADHITCVGNVGTSKALFYLFGPTKLLGAKNENEWAAWTPEGYYATSEGGERLLGWVEDRGPGQFSELHPVDRFRKHFHRPDLIRRLLEHGAIE